MVPGGGINPAYIQWAQQQANARSALGVPVPGYMNEAGGLPFVGPKAYSEGLGKGQAEAQTAGPIQEAKNRADFNTKPEMFRPGAGMGTAATGPTTAMPQLEKVQNPDGTTSLVPVNPLTGQPQRGGASQGGNGGITVPGISDAQKAVLQSNLEDTRGRLKEYHAEGTNAVEQAANGAAINDLLGRVRMGWNANLVQEGARVLSALGVSDTSVQSFLKTDPSAGDALNKMFLGFSAAAVRQMGAREPGSVISLFAKAYPNLETMPHAAELMNNALRMQAQWKADRANAADQWDSDQQTRMGMAGQNYRGLKGFEGQFSQTNNPRAYWRAAAALTGEKGIAWEGVSAKDAQRIYGLIPAGSRWVGGDGNTYVKPQQNG